MSAETDPEHHFQVHVVKETNAEITLHVSRSPHETVVFTYTPPYKVEVDFPGIEQEASAEFPEVTIEGRIAKNNDEFGGAKYDKDKGMYSVRIAHQYDPSNPKVAWYYTVIAEGATAEAAYGLYLNQRGMPVHIEGWDISSSVKLDKGTKGVIKASRIEKLPATTKPSHDILPTRQQQTER